MEGVELWAVADEFVEVGSGFPGDVEATDRNDPLGGMDVRREHVEGGRFASSVHTQKAEAFTRSYTEGQVADGGNLLLGVVLCQVDRSDHVVHCV